MKEDSFKKHEKELDEISKKLSQSIRSLFDTISKVCIDAANEYERIYGVTAEDEMDKVVYSGKGDGWANAKKCVNCNGVGTFNKGKQMCYICMGSGKSDQKPFEDSEEWIDLDIDNLPERFFTRDDIEIEVLFCISDWRKIDSTLKNKLLSIEGIKEDNNKYRYRIKPIESIRVTQKELNALSYFYFNRNMPKEEFEKAYCRKVEIID